jgi:hypothetical protein
MASIEGEKMKTLGFARRLQDPAAFVQTLRDHGVKSSGPYRTPKGSPIYILADCVVTERELLDLATAGKLDAAGVSDLAAKIMKNSA